MPASARTYFTLPASTVLVFLLSLASATAAQAPAASVRGLVMDPDGRPVRGAAVVLTRPAGGSVARGETDERGTYELDRLPAGRYELRVALDGFRADPAVVNLTSAGEVRLDITLRISALAEALIVSAAQVDLPLSSAPDSVTVIGASELAARGITTVAGALRLVPGLVVAQAGGPGAITAVFPRGGESDFTLVLVDGVRLNSFGGGYDFAHLPVGDIERIEIVRGPQSALFGSDAIGAVVQIVTRHGGSARAAGTIETGGFGTRRAAVDSSGTRGPWSWGTAVEHLSSDGYTGPAPGTGDIVTNDDYRLRHVSASLGWRGTRTHARADARSARAERGFPGPFGSNPGGTFGGIDRISRGTTDTRALSLAVSQAWTPRLRHRSQVTVGDFDGDFVSAFGRTEFDTRRLAARTQADMTLAGGVGATAGVELTRERADSTFITGTASQPVPVRRRVMGWFGELRAEAAGRLFAAAGLRLEQVRREALDADAPSAFSPRPAFDADTVRSTNPKVSMSWFLQSEQDRHRSWTRLRAAAGTGFRPPDAFEIAFTDNPGLRPERSRSVEAGVEQTLLSGALVVDATWFHNVYDDLIVTVGQSIQGASRYRSDNISNARSRGVEAGLALRTAWGLDARATWTWLDTAVLALDGLAGQAPPPFRVGDALLRRPRHQGSLDVVATRGRVSTHGRVGARSRTLDVDPSFGAFGGVFRAAGYVVADAGAAVRVHPAATVTIRVTNLFDRAYEDVLGFPALGRSATLGLRLAAGR